MPKGKDKFKESDQSAARGNTGHARAVRANQFRHQRVPSREVGPRVPTNLAGHARTKTVAKMWLRMLNQKGGQAGYEYRMDPSVKGSFKIASYRGGVYKETYSLPTLSSVFNEEGLYRGHQSAIRTATLPEAGGGMIETPFDYIARNFRAGMSSSQLNQVVGTAMAKTRWSPVSRPGMAGTAIPGMHRHQYRVDLGQGFPSDSPFEIASVPPSQMVANFFSARKRMQSQFGKKLYIDVGKETSLAMQQYSAYAPGHIDPFGGLYKGGFKMLQRYRTIPMHVNPSMRVAVTQRPEQYGFGNIAGSTAGNMMFHGRMIETGFMADMANIDPRTGRVIDKNLSQVPVLNTSHRFMLGGKATSHFTDVDQAIHARGFQSMLARATRGNLVEGHRYRGSGTGTAYHGFITKTNLARTAKASTIGAGVMRPFGRTDPGYMLEALLGTFQMGMLKRGAGKQSIIKAMRSAIGTQHLRAGGGRVVMKGFEGGEFSTSGIGRLFDIELPEDWMSLSAKEQAAYTKKWSHQQFGKINQIIGRMSKASGMTLGDLENMGLIKRGEGGLVEEFMSFGGVAQREQDMYSVRGSMGKGLNVKSGLRITDDMVWSAKMMGAGQLADYMDMARRQPGIKAHMDFRTGAMASMSHLTTGSNPLAVSGGLTVDDLLGSKAGKFSAFFSGLEKEIRDRPGIMDTTDAAARIHKFAKAEGLDKLAGLFEDTPGYFLNLGSPREIGGSVKVKGQTQTMSGTLSHLPIANIAAGGGDDYAFALGRLLSTGPGNTQALNRLAKQLLPVYTGGHGGFYHKLFAPKLGQAVSGRIQNPVASTGRLKPDDLFNEHVKHHLRRAGAKYDPNATYVMASKSKLKELSPSMRKLHGQQGYVRGLVHRWPETGRAFGSARFIFTDDMPGLRGRSGFVMPKGMAGHLLGDVDADDMMAVFADKNDEQLLNALAEVEKLQATPIGVQQKISSSLFRQEMSEASEDFTKFLGALESGDPSDIMSIMAKSTPGKQLEGMLAAQSTKTTTPLIDPLAKSKGAALALGIDRGVVNLNADERRIAGELIPAMIESALTKHEGTNTLEAVQQINAALQNESVAAKVLAGEAPDDLVGMYRSLFADSMAVFHERKGAGGFAAGLGEGRLYDAMLAGPVGRDQFHEFFGTKKGTSIIREFAKADLLGQQAEQALEPYAVPSKKVFNLKHVKKLQTTAFGEIPIDKANPLIEALAELKGYDRVTGVGFSPAGSGTKEAAKAAKDATQGLEEATRKPLKQRAKGLYGELVDWAFNTAKRHPGKTAAGAAIVGTTALMAGLYGMSNAVGRVTHQASQPTPERMTPDVQYVMNPYDQIGYDLSMRGRTGPQGLQFAQGVANQMPHGADVRLMDSRVGISDRALGNMASDKMDSVYARSYI